MKNKKAIFLIKQYITGANITQHHSFIIHFYVQKDFVKGRNACRAFQQNVRKIVHTYLISV